MNKTILAIALSIAALGTAQAQTRFFVGAGLTGGGDKLATARYERLGNVDIRAGGLLAFTGGVDYTVSPQFALQASIGYHVDQAHADNGEIRFQRFPIELLAYYTPAPQWRLGAGARYLADPKLSSSGAGYIGDYQFDSSTGGIVEAEYMVSPQIGVKVRYVAEKLQFKNSSAEVDGNHVGIFANFYF